jgi:ABC-type transport system involved in cytochrome bd biosynthesis fused ATPase/permease subunit
VTHGVQFLPSVNQILVIVDGDVSESGSYEQLLLHNGPFAQVLRSFLQQDEEEEDNDSSQEDDSECEFLDMPK